MWRQNRRGGVKWKEPMGIKDNDDGIGEKGIEGSDGGNREPLW